MTEDANHQQPTLHGTQPPLDTWQQRIDAVEQAFDYRGDVTIETVDNRSITGYVFDRQCPASGAYLRLMLPDSAQRVTIKYDEIVTLTFSGKDNAEGKSWEAWVKRHQQKNTDPQDNRQVD